MRNSPIRTTSAKPETRDEAEQCGVEQGRASELVKLRRRSERVFEVVWSLSDAARGRLRRGTAEG